VTSEWIDESAVLREWLIDQGLGVASTEDGFAIDDGEVRLDVTDDEDRFVVRKTWRNEDRGIAMSSPLWVDVERYLTISYANAARTRVGLRPLRPIAKPAVGPGAVADGFALSGDLDQGFTLTGPFPGEPRQLHFASDIDAAKFSRYVVLDADEIRERLLRADADLLA
jgi:hypothetical protein